MNLIDRCERRLGWLSFPGLLRYYAIFHLLIYLLQFINPQIGQLFLFDRERIFEGEYWRVVSFIIADSGFGGISAFSMLFQFFMVMVSFMLSDTLEGAWGVFRTSLYFYIGYFGLLLANFLYPTPLPNGGLHIYTAAFFAFATLFPRHEFLVFFILSVQVRWLAILTAALLLFSVITQPIYLGYLVLAFSNYLLFAGIPALRGQARIKQAKARRKKFDHNKLGKEDSFHCCKVCGRTEISDPHLAFRIAKDGEEYCEDHLPKSFG